MGPEGDVMGEIKEKTMRQNVNHVFKWLFFYNILLFVVPSVLNPFLPDQGAQMIIATVFGAGLVFLCTSRRWKVNPFTAGPKKMNGRDFITLFGIFAIAQIITLVVTLITQALGIQGTSIDMGDMTVPLIIYAALVGPFVEEMIYRGFAIGTMKRKGLIAAILLSSLAFGLMHGNLSQFVIGSFSGLLLGFLFADYSIFWCILIHVINNSIGVVLTVIPASMQEAGTGIAYGIYGVFAVIGIVQLIRRRAEIKDWFADPEKRMQQGGLKGILSSAWMWIFAVFYLGIIAVLMIFPDISTAVNSLK